MFKVKIKNIKTNEIETVALWFENQNQAQAWLCNQAYLYAKEKCKPVDIELDGKIFYIINSQDEEDNEEK